MKNEKRTESKYKHSVRKKLKRIIAVALSVLMVTSIMDYSGFMNVSAETIDEASVSVPGGTPTNYTTLEAAIAAAQGISGSTVTLLKDVTTESKVKIDSGTFTIDLNTNTWTYQSSGSYWMLEQLSPGDITIENGNITGGAVVERGGTLTFNHVNLSNDGAPAIEFHNSNDSKVIFNSGSVCATNYYFSVDVSKIFNKVCSMQINGGTFSGGNNSNIRVAQGADLEMTGGEVQGTLEVNNASAKLTGGRYGMIKAVTCGNIDNFLGEGYAYRSNSAGTPWVQNTAITEVSGVTVQQLPVKITTQPQDVSANYGDAFAHTLSVMAQKSATATGEIAYQWYKVKSGTESTDIAIGTNSSTYEIPKGLAIGTVNNYYCAITCSGYTINTRNANYKVDKATPVVAVNAAVTGEIGSRQAELIVQVSSVGEGIYPTGTVKLVDCTNGSELDIAGASAVAVTDGKTTYTWTGLTDKIYKVKAVYSGDGNYNTATSGELAVDTIKKNQSPLTIENSGTKNYGDSDFVLTTTGGDGNGAVTFTSSDPTIVSVSGNMATIHKIGTVTITAKKAADNTYIETTIEKNFQINVSNGATYTIGNMVYKVTNPKTNGNGTVTFLKSTKSKSKLKGTLKIADTVKIGGKSFKITAINAKALKGYTKLTAVTLGKNVTTIGKEAFYNCKKLRTITINAKQLKLVGKNAIKNISRSAVIKVTSSKVKAYKKLFKSKTGFTGDKQIMKK